MAPGDSWHLCLFFLNWINRETKFYQLFQPKVLIWNLEEQLLYKSYMGKLDPVNLVRFFWLFQAKLRKSKEKKYFFTCGSRLCIST